MTRRSLIVGKDRFVIGPWHDDPTIAYVAVVSTTTPLVSPAAVERCLEHVVASGFTSAVTAALTGNDAHVFASAGFTPRERLHVLRHDIDGPLPAPDPRIRRARRADRDAVLDIDRRAFESFWHLGPDGLQEALDATASVRFRVLTEADRVIGYAVTGRSHDMGYLQRLGVEPDRVRGGIGRALVSDSLRWLRRRRARALLVNTQETNAAALALYLSQGFRMESDQLVVMAWSAA